MSAGHVAKAILGAAIAGVGCLATAAIDDGIVLAEWLTAAGAALTAAGGVYGIPNATTKGEQLETVEDSPELRESDTWPMPKGGARHARQ